MSLHDVEQIRYNVPQKDNVNITFDNQQTHKNNKMRTRSKISNSSNAPDLKEIRQLEEKSGVLTVAKRARKDSTINNDDEDDAKMTPKQKRLFDAISNTSQFVQDKSGESYSLEEYKSVISAIMKETNVDEEEKRYPTLDEAAKIRDDGLDERVAGMTNYSTLEATAKRYKKREEAYVRWCNKDPGKRNPVKEVTLCNYLIYILDDTKEIGPGSVWHTFAILANYCKKVKNVDINKFGMLRSLLLARTKNHIKKKARVLTLSQVTRVLDDPEIFDEANDDHLLWKNLFIFMFFGLLRCCEVTAILFEWVSFESNFVQVNYQQKTKTLRKPFSFSIPNHFKSTILKYVNQISSANKVKGMAFFQMMNKTFQMRRGKTAGRRAVERMAEHIGDALNFEEELTTHFVRRTSATLLADTGISLLHLQKAGRWKSAGVCQEYVEDSTNRRTETMKRLLPAELSERKIDDERMKTPSAFDEEDESEESMGSTKEVEKHIPSTHTYHNCVINTYHGNKKDGLPTTGEELESEKNLKEIEFIAGYLYIDVELKRKYLGPTAKEFFMRDATGEHKVKRVSMHERVFFNTNSNTYMLEKFDPIKDRYEHTMMPDYYNHERHEKTVDLLFTDYLREVTSDGTEISPKPMNGVHHVDFMTTLQEEEENVDVMEEGKNENYVTPNYKYAKPATLNDFPNDDEIVLNNLNPSKSTSTKKDDSISQEEYCKSPDTGKRRNLPIKKAAARLPPSMYENNMTQDTLNTIETDLMFKGFNSSISEGFNENMFVYDDKDEFNEGDYVRISDEISKRYNL